MNADKKLHGVKYDKIGDHCFSNTVTVCTINKWGSENKHFINFKKLMVT